MPPTECPIPAVEDALSPYIHTREKTTRIRQSLTQHIKNYVQEGHDPAHLSLSLPPSSLQPSSFAFPVSGLYKDYLQAIRDQRHATERYDAIKVELDELLHKTLESDHSSQRSTSLSSTQEYAGLLRQRRQQRKLEIVQDTLLKLLDVEPNPAMHEIKVSLREELGEPPQPPVATLDGGMDTSARVQQIVFQLKKELLLAKNKLSASKAANGAATKRAADGEVNRVEQTLILRNARDELISWVEGELAKIPEDEVDASQADLSFVGDVDSDVDGTHSNLSKEELLNRLEKLYDVYVISRQRHIAEAEATLERTAQFEAGMTTQPGAPKASVPPRQPQTSLSSTNSSIQAYHLLPYLAVITSMNRDEGLMQQQTSHLRRQLVLSCDETNNNIRRLAGESLLVPPDSSSVSTWAKAAKDASEKTKSTVLEQVIEGEASVAQAKRVLESLRSRRKALDGLRRDL